MNTPDQLTTLLRRILAHPRVKAYCEGRGWYTPVIRKPIPAGCIGITDPIVGFEYTGPDLAAESNLHELLGLADAMFKFPVDIEFKETAINVFAFEATGYVAEDDYACGHGPTRTLAVLAALGRALNIGDTE